MLFLKTFLGYREPAVPPIDPIKQYIETSRDRFLKQFDDVVVDSSVNIEPIVYQQKELDLLLSDPDNHLEKVWKARILIRNTPIGNITMYYDIFKQGFSYWCDQPIVNYGILNAVAMKYVVDFKCRDFFVDENIVPVEKTSPLIEWYKEKPAEKSGVVGGGAVAVVSKDAPFAKLKNYASRAATKATPSTKTLVGKPKYFKTKYPWFWRLVYRVNYYVVFPVFRYVIFPANRLFDRFVAHMVGFRPDWRTHDEFGQPYDKKLAEVAAETSVAADSVEKIQNHFIYLGRFRNFSVLMTPKKSAIASGFSTQYDQFFDAKISYKAFKKTAVTQEEPTVLPEESWVDL